MEPVSLQFITAPAPPYSTASKEKFDVLHYPIGFIDITVLDIASYGKHDVLHAADVSHKRKNALKCQTNTTFDTLTLHFLSLMAGSCQVWALLVDFSMDGQLETAFLSDGQ